MKRTEKKVAFVCDYAAVYGGNFIPSMLSLEEALNDLGYTCIYIFPKEAKGCGWFPFLQAQGKTFLACDFRCGKKTWVTRIARLCDENGISIVHAHFCRTLNLELLSMYRPKLRIFIHLHSDFSAGKKSFKTQIYDFLTFRVLCGKVTFLSVSEAFTRQNPGKVYWIPNALAENRLQCAHASREQVRSQLRVQDSEILCELYGWSPYIKGVDIAASAVAARNQQSEHEKMKLVIVCGTEYTPQKMRQYIAEHTALTGNEDFLLFLEPTEDVFSYHEAADLLISASRSEAFPYAILEMLSLGKKCVISNIPGTKWALKYPCVFCFESGNQEQCNKALRLAEEGGFSQDADTAIALKQEYSISQWVAAILGQYGIPADLNS